MDLGIAVHVAADPGAEAQHDRQRQRSGRGAIDVLEGELDLLVEGRDDAVDDLGQVEQHVLAFVRDRQALARVVLRLPARGQFHAHAFPDQTPLIGRL